MKNKEQIELAQVLIANLQDYIELAKVEKKLKTESVESQIKNVTEYVVNNVEKL